MIQKVYNTIFFGTPDFAVPVLGILNSLKEINIILVVTQPDKPVGKKQIMTAPPIKIFSEKNKLKVIQPKEIKSEKIRLKLQELKPDLAIVAAYGKIIPTGLLKIPEHGWLNIHASLLPKYRGASPIQSAILAGEKISGVTLMKIDSGLDTGMIISQKTTEISPSDNFQTLHDKLSRLGTEIIKENLIDYLDQKIEPRPQNNSQATVTKIISRQDGRINWQKSASYIERQIRAYNPWPGAYCIWPVSIIKSNKNLVKKIRVKVLSAEKSKNEIKLTPGYTQKDGHSIIAGCGQGNLQLNKLQLEGKKPLEINEFMRGYPGFTDAHLE